jgi:tRNA1Val (adenine37-N6)-methyltransferase
MIECIHGLRYETALSFCRPAVDSLALAAFAPCRGKTVDLCCGAGLIGLLLCRRDSRVQVTGVDCAAEACAEATQNVAQNALSARFSVVCGDVRDCGDWFPAGCFDGAVANPPYHAVGAHSPNAARDTAHFGLPLPDLCRAAGYLVRTGGSFSLVYPAARLAELFHALADAGFSPKRIQLIRHTAAHAPSLVLVDARRCGGVGLQFESDLILYDADGTETAAYRAVCDR